MKKGFTLMELLIVIAIIGILVSIAAASYITAQKQSRDSRRASDMKAMQNAWELYYADNNANYPGPGGTPTPIPCLTPADTETMKPYLAAGYPVDPKDKTTYVSRADWSGCRAISYCFCAGVELSKNANTTYDCKGVTETAYPQGFYCVSSLQ